MKIIILSTTPSVSLFNKLNSKSLSKSYNVIYLTNLIREEINKKSEIWKTIIKKLKSNDFINEEAINEMIINKLSKNKKNIIISFPRTSSQFISFEKELDKKNIDYELTGLSVLDFKPNSNNQKEYFKLKGIFGKKYKMIEFEDIEEFYKFIGNGIN